jgi:hypothetical protein
MVQRLDDPVELGDRQHRAPLRRTAPGSLAVTHIQRTEPAEPSGFGTVPGIGQIQQAALLTTQAERVHRLEHRRVTHRRQGALAAQRPDLLHSTVGGVEQGLDFVEGQRPTPRITLVVGDVQHGVPFVEDLRHNRSEPGLALGRPAVARISGIVAEHLDRDLIAAGR